METIVTFVKHSALHVLALMCLLLASLSYAEDPVNAPMGSMKARNHYILLYTGEQGPLYTVKDLKGKTLADKIDEKTLISQFPTLEPMIRGFADDASLSPARNNNMEILDSNP